MVTSYIEKNSLPGLKSIADKRDSENSRWGSLRVVEAVTDDPLGQKGGLSWDTVDSRGGVRPFTWTRSRWATTDEMPGLVHSLNSSRNIATLVVPAPFLMLSSLSDK